MTTLSPGANVAVPASDLTVDVRYGSGTVDASALLVTSAGKVRSDADFVFYNQPDGGGGSVRYLGGSAGGQRLFIRPTAIPADIDRVVVAASVDSGTFAGVTGLAVEVRDISGALIASFPASAGGTETVMVLGEVYRRQHDWKFRAIGQGYASGLAGLATDYGVSVDDSPPPPPEAPVWVPPPPAAPAFAPPPPPPPPPPPAAPVVAPAGPDPDVAALPVDLAKAISLRKETVRITLEKKGIPGVQARVALVLDRTGSMRNLYNNGTVGRLVERLAPVAARLDSDGSLDAWAFADAFARLPSLRIPELPYWVQQFVYINAKGGGQLPLLPGGQLRYPDPLADVRGGNNEPLVIRDIIDTYLAEPGDPVLVIFFSDGGVSRSKQISDLLVYAAHLPIFWQFVGLGRAEYGILEKFDTMPGRLVDNAGFFQVDDIEKITDAELYDRLLDEFPSWLRDARAAGVIR